MKYNFENKELKFSEKSLEFDDEIKEVIEFDGFLVVRTDYYKSTTNENVYGVNLEGKITWQIKKMSKLTYKGKEFIGITDPYSGLTKIDNDRIKLHNWDSTTFEVNPRSGELLTDPMDSRVGKRPW